MADFTRGFRLHIDDNLVYDGALFPSGRVVAVDDPERGFVTLAVSVEALIERFPGARVEWPSDTAPKDH